MTLWTLGPWVICNNQQLSIAACPVRRALCSGCPVCPFSPLPIFPSILSPFFIPHPCSIVFHVPGAITISSREFHLQYAQICPGRGARREVVLTQMKNHTKGKLIQQSPHTHTHIYTHADRTYTRTHTHVYPLRRTSTCTGGHCWFNGRPAAAQCTTMRLGGAKRGNCTGTGV